MVRFAPGVALVAIALTLPLAGCGGSDPAPPPPPGPAVAPNSIDLPGDYPNVAIACDGATRIYVTERGYKAGTGIAVIPNDPRCTHAAPTPTASEEN